jgi:CHAD domain-containing protein
MPYRFKIDEPIEAGFRRIAAEEITAALTELEGGHVHAKNVHECRKCLKRLRSLVRLAAGSIGTEKARRRTKSLGAIARLLSARRDQTVIAETIAKLSKDTSDAAAALAPLKASWPSTGNIESESLDPEIAGKARTALLKEAKKLQRAKFQKRGFAALTDGLDASYRQGRHALADAYDEGSDEAFHDLRKAVQWHWRQMSLLAKAWPQEFDARIDEARDLSQLLGEDHDLAMLVAATAECEKMSSAEKDAAIAFCRQQQQVLRATVERRAARLFSEKPKAFVRRVRDYWHLSRSVGQDLEKTVASDEIAGAVVAPAAAEGAKETAKRPSPSKPRLASKSENATPSQRRA